MVQAHKAPLYVVLYALILYHMPPVLVNIPGLHIIIFLSCLFFLFRHVCFSVDGILHRNKEPPDHRSGGIRVICNTIRQKSPITLQEPEAEPSTKR